MAKPLHILAFEMGLVLGPALASSTLSLAQSGVPASRITEARQNAPKKPASQPSPVSASAPATNSGGATKGADPEDPAASETSDGAANSGLQTLIQDAMGKQPSLAGNTVSVSVTAEGIELSGNVSSSRERLTAARLAHSYAGSRKVINHIVITERGGSTQPQ